MFHSLKTSVCPRNDDLLIKWLLHLPLCLFCSILVVSDTSSCREFTRRRPLSFAVCYTHGPDSIRDVWRKSIKNRVINIADRQSLKSGQRLRLRLRNRRRCNTVLRSVYPIQDYRSVSGNSCKYITKDFGMSITYFWIIVVETVTVDWDAEITGATSTGWPGAAVELAEADVLIARIRDSQFE